MELTAERQREIVTKLGRLRTRMAEQQLDAVTLTNLANTAWMTAGAATYVNAATETGVATIVITADRAIVVTDGIEAPRLEQEERLGELGFTFAIDPWYARGGELAHIIEGLRVGHDGTGTGHDFSTDLRDLRTHLQPEEVTRIREVGQLTGAAMQTALRDVQPGMTEFDVAARLAAASLTAGGLPIVILVASDARIAAYRHPLPTDKRVEHYLMAVLCLRKYGLVASVTRLIHFGPMPDALRAKAVAVARVDAQMILGTQPGRTLGDMFALARAAYAEAGFPEAIEEHHQGGSAGYQSREVLALPENPTPIALHQAFAWNPSVRGVKSEDTILVTANGPLVLTAIDGWPTWDMSVDGTTIARPAIEER